MQPREALEYAGALGGQRDDDRTPIPDARAPGDEARIRATRDERHHAMVFRLQPLRELADRRMLAAGKPLDLQQQLILERGQTMTPSQLFAVAKKTAKLVTKLGKRAVLAQGNGLRTVSYAHRKTQSRTNRFFISYCDVLSSEGTPMINGSGDREPSSSPCLMQEFEDELLPRPPDWPTVRAFRKEKRGELLAARAALPLRERQRLGERIRANVDETLVLPRTATLGIFWPIRGEPDLREVAKRHVETGGCAALPVVTQQGAAVEFWQWEPDAAMGIGFWKIPVPAERRPLTPDVLLIPLVGHDAAGYRLGYGGGYYDRTLAAAAPKPFCIGVGYAAGALATIHPQAHDVPMDVVVTEEWVRRFRADGRR